MKIKLVLKGGSGSGNFDHVGRPGLVGGSAEGSGEAPHSSESLNWKSSGKADFVATKQGVEVNVALQVDGPHRFYAVSYSKNDIVKWLAEEFDADKVDRAKAAAVDNFNKFYDALNKPVKRTRRARGAGHDYSVYD